MTNLRTDLAAHIAQVDAGNQLGPYQLAVEVSDFLIDREVIGDQNAESAVTSFAYEANRGVGYLHPKRLTGANLAAAIVDRFNLEEN